MEREELPSNFSVIARLISQVNIPCHPNRCFLRTICQTLSGIFPLTLVQRTEECCRVGLKIDTVFWGFTILILGTIVYFSIQLVTPSLLLGAGSELDCVMGLLIVVVQNFHDNRLATCAIISGVHHMLPLLELCRRLDADESWTGAVDVWASSIINLLCICIRISKKIRMGVVDIDGARGGKFFTGLIVVIIQFVKCSPHNFESIFIQCVVAGARAFLN